MDGSVAIVGTARAQRAAATRESLLQIARTLFETRGYFDIGTPELAAAAGVTRGALYHHFAGKLELFEAVFRLAEQELFAEAMNLFEPEWTTPVARLRNGVNAYLRSVAAAPGRQRILLVDGPAVLGWARWRDMESASFRDLLEHNIASLMADGHMCAGDPKSVSQLMLAAFNEAALAIAHAPAPDREAERRRVTDALTLLIDGLLTANAAG